MSILLPVNSSNVWMCSFLARLVIPGITVDQARRSVQPPLKQPAIALWPPRIAALCSRFTYPAVVKVDAGMKEPAFVFGLEASRERTADVFTACTYDYKARLGCCRKSQVFSSVCMAGFPLRYVRSVIYYSA
jgi:hypothetical protein